MCPMCLSNLAALAVAGAASAGGLTLFVIKTLAGKAIGPHADKGVSDGESTEDGVTV